jgi:hypothetical protein
MVKNWTIGHDVEFALQDPKTKEIKSAIGIVPGDKDVPYDMGNDCKAFYDNVLAECNAKVSHSKEEFLKNNQDCFQRYAQLVHPYVLVPMASHTYPASELTHPDAFKFGCEQSYSAHEVAPNPQPQCDPKSGFRTAGGHIHLGGEFFPLNDDWGKIWAIRMMDIFLGVPSLFLDQDPTSLIRRKLYGGAGDHRPKPYGVEYRSPSNFWVATPELSGLIYDICEFVLDVCVNEQHEQIYSIHEKKIVNVINKWDKKAAKPYMEICERLMPAKLWKQVNAMSKARKPTSFYDSWSIKVK